MKVLTKEVRIALVAIVGIVVLFFGMKFLKGVTMFSNNYSYIVCFDDVSGMSVASPVYANGFKVGVVESVDYDYDSPGNILVKIGLNKDMRLPKGTRAEIASDLLGNVKVQLRLGSYEAGEGMLAVGDTIFGGMQEGVMNKASNMLPAIEQLLPKLDSILASVNTLLKNPALGNSIDNFEVITTNLTTTTRQLHLLANSLNQQVPSLLGKADGVLDNTETLTRNFSQLDVASTLSKVNATLDNVEQMTARLNSNDGTLGLLMRDPSLYRNLNSTMSHADSLMIDFKQHPKRYVHFSVFGRKDK